MWKWITVDLKDISNDIPLARWLAEKFINKKEGDEK